MVIGCPGAGKSTFARALREKTGLPVTYLDRLFWNADRTHVSREELDSRIARAAAEPAWIIDGNYTRSLGLRLDRADKVFFLDYPVEVCLSGVRARRMTVREDMPWVETEEDAEFMQYIRDFAAAQLPKIHAILSQYPQMDITVFRCREEAEAYLQGMKP